MFNNRKPLPSFVADSLVEQLPTAESLEKEKTVPGWVGPVLARRPEKFQWALETFQRLPRGAARTRMAWIISDLVASNADLDRVFRKRADFDEWKKQLSAP